MKMIEAIKIGNSVSWGFKNQNMLLKVPERIGYSNNTTTVAIELELIVYSSPSVISIFFN
jgi:hypothetical protein